MRWCGSWAGRACRPWAAAAVRRRLAVLRSPGCPFCLVLRLRALRRRLDIGSQSLDSGAEGGDE